MTRNRMFGIAARYAEKQNFSLSQKILGKFTDAPGPSLIIPRLYLGDYKDAGDLMLLESLRITHVVSVVETQPWPLLKTKLNKLHINIHDRASEDIQQHLDHTTQYIQRALHRPESIVLVSARTAFHNWLLTMTEPRIGPLLQRQKQKRSRRCGLPSSDIGIEDSYRYH